MTLITDIQKKFQAYANAGIAAQQTEYMRFLFPYYGLKAPVRQGVQKPFLRKENLPPKSEFDALVRDLWEKPQREFQYFGLDLAIAFRKHYEKKDIALFEHMIVTKSWWDTVDMIASKVVGGYFLLYPEERVPYINKWIASNNMWLQRTAILFQLKYKEKTDTFLFSKVIHALNGSDEFFINKAIGWALREFGKSNPAWVLDFVAKTSLDPLSHSEALKRLK